MKESLILNLRGLSKAKGVSLIESLLSMTIMSFGLLFVVSIFPLVVKNTYDNELDNIAFFIATSKTEELVVLGYQRLEEGVIIEDYGEVDFYDNYKRVTTITCFHPERDCENEETGMMRVDVEVFTKRKQESITNITTLISRR